ncbi:hypothetical protein M3Y99_01145600 [Aphelenchoides fujianensis]|nr:hypothetical protein M3Y99_01145600 [Aphelenchoides fujianensis]
MCPARRRSSRRRPPSRPRTWSGGEVICSPGRRSPPSSRPSSRPPPLRTFEMSPDCSPSCPRAPLASRPPLRVERAASRPRPRPAGSSRKSRAPLVLQPPSRSAVLRSTDRRGAEQTGVLPPLPAFRLRFELADFPPLRPPRRRLRAREQPFGAHRASTPPPFEWRKDLRTLDLHLHAADVLAVDEAAAALHAVRGGRPPHAAAESGEGGGGRRPAADRDRRVRRGPKKRATTKKRSRRTRRKKRVRARSRTKKRSWTTSPSTTSRRTRRRRRRASKRTRPRKKVEEKKDDEEAEILNGDIEVALDYPPPRFIINVETDLGNYSPKWRGDDANEARPLQRLSLDGHEELPAPQQQPTVQSANRPAAKPSGFDGVAQQPQKPLQRNGSPAIGDANAAAPLLNGRVHTAAAAQPLASKQPPAAAIQRPLQPAAQPQKPAVVNAAMTPKTTSPISTFGAQPTAAAQPLGFAAKSRAPTALPQVQAPRQPPQQPTPPARSRESQIAGRLGQLPAVPLPGRAARPARGERGRSRPRPPTLQPAAGARVQGHGQTVPSHRPRRLLEEGGLRRVSAAERPKAGAGGQREHPHAPRVLAVLRLLAADDRRAPRRGRPLHLHAGGGGYRRAEARNYLLREDFVPMLMDLIYTYPGLSFLVNSTQFHTKYCDVVIVRIYWNVNRSWTGRITANELRRSNFLSTLHLLETVSDINRVTNYFSYEGFYVVYCSFWEIDKEHKMILTREDMRHHRNGAITDAVIDRIFSGAVMRTPHEQRASRGRGPIRSQPAATIGFEDFVAFLLAEEDKKHPTSQEYWFRILDLDGDGVLSLYEMEYFYREIERKLISHNFDTLSCSIRSRHRPAAAAASRIRFFNTFVNMHKYLEQESSEGEKASVTAAGDKELSDWDRFVALEYEILMAENDCSDDYADEIDVVLDQDAEGDEAEDDLVQQLMAKQRANVA